MKFYEQKLSGVYLIKPEPFADHRGMFSDIFVNKNSQTMELLLMLNNQCF